MSVVQTILVYLVIPATVVGVMALLIWGPGVARAQLYRPGRDWPYDPVWYAPHPLAVQHPVGDDPPIRTPQLPAGESAPTSVPMHAGPTAAGGARGTW